MKWSSIDKISGKIIVKLNARKRLRANILEKLKININPFLIKQISTYMVV